MKRAISRDCPDDVNASITLETDARWKSELGNNQGWGSISRECKTKFSL